MFSDEAFAAARGLVVSFYDLIFTECLCYFHFSLYRSAVTFNFGFGCQLLAIHSLSMKII